LDDWFRTRASQDQRRRVAQVFVAIDEKGIAGFYSLSMFTLALDSIPAELANKLPRYDAIPAALAAAESVAAFAIVVDAKDGRGRSFYDSHGLIPLPSTPNRLFLPTET